MVYPERIEVGATQIPIITHDKPLNFMFPEAPENRMVIGAFRFAPRDIHLYDMPDNPRLCMENLTHEIFEAIVKIADLPLDHQTLSTMASMYTQAALSCGLTYSLN